MWANNSTNPQRSEDHEVKAYDASLDTYLIVIGTALVIGIVCIIALISVIIYQNNKDK